MPTVSYATLWILEVFMLLLAVGLLAEFRRYKGGAEVVAADELLDVPAPVVRAVDVRSGRKINSTMFPSPKYTLLFVSPTCGVCHELASGLTSLESSELVVVSGEGHKAWAKAAALFPYAPLVLGDPGGRMARRYAATRTPTVVFVRDRIVRGHGHPRDAVSLARMREEVFSGGVVETTSR
jgi:hypothetical protein